MKELKTMKFDNPMFQEGLNFTVRLEPEWAEAIFEGDFFKVEDWPGVAQCKRVVVCDLLHTPGYVLEFEHDDQCRSLSGLQMALSCAYPEFRKKNNEEQIQQIVTCIGFVLYTIYSWPWSR